MFTSPDSPFREILSNYSPRRVKKLRLTPGRLSKFCRLMSMTLVFVFGILLLNGYGYSWEKPYQCKEVQRNETTLFSGSIVDNFDVIPKHTFRKDVHKQNADKKIIVLYGRKVWSKFDKWTQSDWHSKCSRQDCSISLQSTLIPHSSAVIFNAQKMPTARHTKLLQKMKQTINIPTKFVFLSGLTPAETNFDPEDYDMFFDYTITYRKESDIRIPYWPYDSVLSAMYRVPEQNRREEKAGNGVDGEYEQYSFARLGKHKFMLSIIDTCGNDVWSSGFVHKMRDEGVIDIYTTKNCTETIEGSKIFPCSNIFSDECAKFIEQYKFVILALNVFCDGYIPREYWYAILAWQVVPIIWGCTSDREFLVNNTFFNALDEEYISPTYKKVYRASMNSQEYLDFRIRNEKSEMEKFYWQCELCKILHGEKHPQNDLLSFAEFWDKDHYCGENVEAHRLAKAQLIRTGVIPSS